MNMGTDLIYMMIISGLLFLLVLWVTRMSRNSRLPPSPPGYPLFGNWFELDFERMHLKFNEWSKKYGDIMSFHVFTDTVIILQGFEVLREASLSPEVAEAFSGRQRNFSGSYVLPNDVIFQAWNEKTSHLKKVLTKGMRLYGNDLRAAEPLILKEVQTVARNFHSRNGEAFSPFEDINNFLCRIIMILVTGRELPTNNPSVKLINKVDANLSYLSNPGINTMMMLFPWIRHLPCESGRRYQQIKRDIKELKDLMLKDEQGSKSEGEIRGLLSHLRHTQGQCDVSKENYITDDNIADILIDICAAGVQSTKMFLLMLILVLVHHPEIQREIQAEIDRVLGTDREPRMNDRKDMPYTEATMIEVFRFHSTLPISVPGTTVKDVTFRGYHIPKGSQILKNFWTIHHDETFWDEPSKIKPDRFLDEHGKLLPIDHPKRKRILAFSLGKRICPGEAFSKHRIFLWIAYLLQRYTFLPGTSMEELPVLSPLNFESGIVQGVKHFTMRVIPRQQ
ncbi:cytochrome P450 2C31-like isoform X1 [Liolophura sinensis]|uniref:cytochrome P450 2C31-like isoform X1 n=1 Tax=Liolophura sinensis TaxID=3198878 RepID=UPI00315868EB